MKSIFTRRAASGAVVALAATSLSLGVAGAANAANTLELQGTVTDSAGALADAYVEVDDATTGDTVDWTYTDVNGHYEFDSLPAGAVKVYFEADDPSVYPVTLTSPLPHQDRWSGGARYFKNASVTNVTVDPAAAPVVNAALPQFASIIGNVRVGADAHVADDGFGTYALNTDDDYIGSSSFTDAATGDYRMIVDPSTAVRVQAGASDASVDYLDQWWRDADTLATADAITLAPGQNLSGINFRLTNVLRARQAPQIVGYPTVGQALTALPGTWSRNAETEFSYTWLRNGILVGTGASYTPTVADYHQKLSVVVTALNGEFTGQSSTMTSDVVRYAATERLGAKAKAGRKVAVALKVVSAKQSPVRGKVVVLRNGHVIKSGLKLKKGKVAFTLKNQPKGRQAYTVRFQGNNVLSKVDKTFTVRVHK